MPIKPVPMSAFIPWVTGIGNNGILSVFANNFDPNGYFRRRTGSVNRARRNSGSKEEDRFFNISRPYLTQPEPLKLDIDEIRKLMVEAAA